MTAQLVDGTAVARQVREDVAKGVAELAAVGGDPPGLATVLIGDDPASEVYVRNKRRACVAAGMRDLHRHLPSYVSQGDAAALLDELAASPDVSGILLQLPVPAHLDAEELLARIPAGKDVDGLTTANAGLLAQGRAGLRPCTPSGVIAHHEAARWDKHHRHATEGLRHNLPIKVVSNGGWGGRGCRLRGSRTARRQHRQKCHPKNSFTDRQKTRLSC